MIYKPLKEGIKAEKELENLRAENDKLRNMLEYVALMNDIEIPTEEESNAESTTENA